MKCITEPVSVMVGFVLMVANCTPVEQFFPFQGDEVLHLGDDSSSQPISLSPSYPVLGRQKSSLRVNSNGVISFDGPFTRWTPQRFPLITDNETLLCPYWTDLHPGRGGRVSHNNGSGTNAVRITQLIREHFGHIFVPTGVFIATWDSVPFFGSQLQITNTFQCVLTTDGQDTFLFFLYATGDTTVRRVQAGIYGGDGRDYYTLPNHSHFTNTSNVNQTGLWVFKLDSSIIGGSPNPLTNLTATSVSATDVTLEWTHSTTSSNQPESFQVTCVPAIPAGTTTVTSFVRLEEVVDYTSVTYTMTGLEEYTNYTCSVTERNIFGDGPTSDAISIETDSTVPSGPPLDFRGTVVSPTSLLFEWDPPSEEDRNGLLTGYTLVLTWGTGQERRGNTANTSYTFTELQPGTTYHCFIAARTSIGEGPYHNTTVDTPAVPLPHNENCSDKLGLIVGASGGAILAFIAIITATVLILCIKAFTKRKRTPNSPAPYVTDTVNHTGKSAFSEEMEEQSAMYEKVEALQSPPLPNPYFVEQKHAPRVGKSGQRNGRRLPMPPPTEQSMPAVAPEGVYMSLTSNGSEQGQQSQYMPLSSATRETPDVNITIRRAERYWSNQQESHREPLYINQTKPFQHS